MTTLEYLDTFRDQHPDRSAIVDRYRRFFFDTFMDVLGAYIEWREAAKQPKTFMDRQLAAWGVSQWIPEYPARIVERLLSQDTQMLWINDDATISIALSQLVVDGRVLPAILAKAQTCIRRQLMDSVIRKRGYTAPQDAIECLSDLKHLLGANQ